MDAKERCAVFNHCSLVVLSAHPPLASPLLTLQTLCRISTFLCTELMHSVNVDWNRMQNTLPEKLGIWKSWNRNLNDRAENNISNHIDFSPSFVSPLYLCQNNHTCTRQTAKQKRGAFGRGLIRNARRLLWSTGRGRALVWGGGDETGKCLLLRFVHGLWVLLIFHWLHMLLYLVHLVRLGSLEEQQREQVRGWGWCSGDPSCLRLLVLQPQDDDSTNALTQLL